jgi:hypothetical protein
MAPLFPVRLLFMQLHLHGALAFTPGGISTAE